MKKQGVILLVEDDDVDAMTVERAFRELEISNPLVRRCNGEEALDYLASQSEHPTLILLDLNMPRMGGLEFLEQLKRDDELRTIPVIVLTTSREERDRWGSFQHSVAGYMIKPVDYVHFIEIVKAIDLYWSLSEMP